MDEKTPIEAQLYKPLIDISKQKPEEIKKINQSVIKIFKDSSCINSINKIGEVILDSFSAYSRVKETSQAIADSILKIEQQYKAVIGAVDCHQFSDSLCYALEKIHTATIFTLSTHFETTMIRELAMCFSQANYEAMPTIINQCMARAEMQASDVAFIKSAKIISVLDDQLIYPRGIKTSIKLLNIGTAQEIKGNRELTYDTKTNLFLSEGITLNSKEMNTVSAGKTVFCFTTGDDEFVTEKELISLMAELAQQFGFGIVHETGKKLNAWINDRFQEKAYQNFDKDYYYHARARDKSEAPYVPDQMLRAPFGMTSAGRYNLTGEACFYFADTQNGAEAEVKKHTDLTKNDIQIMKIKPIKPIKLLDLSGALQRGTTFLKMIRYNVKDNKSKMPREYLIPCFIAQCCKNAGFEGIKYYGTKEYTNYVSWNEGYFSFVNMC